MAVSDEPREEAAAAMEAVQRLGLRTLMLTGDNEDAAQSVAKRVGHVNEVHAALLPEEKLRIVHEMERVVMVGDGVNDAPALAGATVGIAMGAMGTAAAMETAHVAIMDSNLERVPYTMAHSRKTMHVLRQNIALSVGTKALVLIVALAGYRNLWLAIAADVGTMLVVTLNALTLL